MSMMRDEILKSALELSEAERLLLATELMESVSDLPPGLILDDPGLEAELDRRFSEAAPGVAWDIVRQQLADDLTG